MTNSEEGSRLIGQAARILKRDAGGALEDADYNLVIRRSQEAVELTLKGALRIWGVDYPKTHHIGDVFAKVAKERNVEITESLCREIETISLWLAQTRSASFYLERSFGEEDAIKAHEDAKFVIEQITRTFSLG